MLPPQRPRLRVERKVDEHVQRLGSATAARPCNKSSQHLAGTTIRAGRGRDRRTDIARPCADGGEHVTPPLLSSALTFSAADSACGAPAVVTSVLKRVEGRPV